MKNVERAGNNRFGNTPAFFDPFEEFDRMFGGRFLDGVFAPVTRAAANFAPAYEIEESDKGYLLSFDIPGIAPDDVQVEVKENQLRVSGERKQEESSRAEGKRIYTERRYGRFERVFTLPPDVDADKIQANHEQGVLHLMLPKTEKVKPRTIKVESGKGGFFSKLIGKDENSSAQ